MSSKEIGRHISNQNRGDELITKEQFINIFPTFRSSPTTLVESILSSSQYKTLTRGVTLLTVGDSCSHIGFLLSGEIRVFKSGSRGREITLYEIYPGETCILNASCILSNKKYPANATVMVDGDILLLTDKLFLSSIEEYADLRKFIFRSFIDRMSAIIELLEEVAFGRMDSRLTDYLVEKAEDQLLNTTHQNIANDLGTSREVISRLLKDFERKGKVALQRNLIKLIAI